MIHTRLIASIFLASMLVMPSLSVAQESFAPGGTYGAKVGNKALNGFANLTTSMLELPKNMINTSNQSNVFYGLTGGLLKGIVHMGGRIAVGIADLITFPLATQPIAYPVYVWDDFDIDTSYGPAFRLDNSDEISRPQMAVSEPAPAPVVSETTSEPVKDYSEQYPQKYPDPNEKIDAYFKKEMMK